MRFGRRVDLWPDRLQFVFGLPPRVALDIPPYFLIIIVASDNVVIEAFLPNRNPNLFCNGTFQLIDHAAGGGYRNRVSIMVGMNLHEQMHMIWHDNELIY